MTFIIRNTTTIFFVNDFIYLSPLITADHSYLFNSFNHKGASDVYSAIHLNYN